MSQKEDACFSMYRNPNAFSSDKTHALVISQNSLVRKRFTQFADKIRKEAGGVMSHLGLSFF